MRQTERFGVRVVKTGKEVALLFKKDRAEQKNVRRAGKSGWSVATSAVLGVLLISALVFFVWNFGKAFSEIPFNGENVAAYRETELLCIVFGTVFVLNLVAGVGKIYASIANAADIRVLQVLPVRAQSVFFYKLAKLYFSTVLQNFLILLPVGLTLGIVMNNGAGYYFGVAFAALALPVIALSLASLIAIPANRVIDRLRNRFFLLLAAFVAVILVAFFLYAEVLKVLESLLASNSIKFLFNEVTMNAIGAYETYAYPVNLLARLAVGTDVWASLGVLLAITAAAAVAMYFSMRAFVPKMLQRRLEGKRKFERIGETKPKACAPFFALVKKEARIVLRTPSYAFQYFAVAVLLPFMCYLSIGIVSQLLESIVQSDSGFEIAVFVVTMFALLTNTFSATNISRDGKMFRFMKTMPVTGGKVLAAKVVFCWSVSLLAIFASTLVLGLTGFVNPGEAVGVFFFVAALSAAEILVATRLDLNRPAFPKGEDSEVEESPSASRVALLGLVTALFVGGAFVALSLILNVRNLTAYRPLITGLSAGSIAALFLGFAVFYFFKGLKRRYREGL